MSDRIANARETASGCVVGEPAAVRRVSTFPSNAVAVIHRPGTLGNDVREGEQPEMETAL
jgi:hypothetical protein